MSLSRESFWRVRAFRNGKRMYSARDCMSPNGLSILWPAGMHMLTEAACIFLPVRIE